MPPKPPARTPAPAVRPARTLPTDRLAAVCAEAKRNIDKTIQVIDKLSHRIGQLDLPRHIKEELLAELELAYPRNTHIGDAIAYLKHNKANILRARERMQRERTAGGPATIPQEVYNYIDKTDEAYTMEDILSYREANGDLPTFSPGSPEANLLRDLMYVEGEFEAIRAAPAGGLGKHVLALAKKYKIQIPSDLVAGGEASKRVLNIPAPPPQGASTGGHKPTPKGPRTAGAALLSPPNDLSDYGPGFQDGVFIVD